MRFGLLAPAVLAGCSFAVGDIELPEAVEGPGVDAVVTRDVGVVADAAGDAAQADFSLPDEGLHRDAVVVDAALQLDVGMADARPPDMHALDAVVTPDMARDAAIVEPPQPVDVRSLAGDWHLYGVYSDASDIPTAFSVILRLLDGRASLLGFDGAVVRRATPFAADPEADWRVQANLFPFVGLTTGRFDLASGLGVLVNDPESLNERPAFVLAVRAPERRVSLPESMLYTRSGLFDPSDGEIGVLTAGAEVSTETSRYAVGHDNALPDRAVYPSDEASRLRLGSDDSIESHIGTIVKDSAGFVALTTQSDAPHGLLAGIASYADQVAARSGRFWCAAMTRDLEGRIVTTGVGGDLGADGHFVWDDGNDAWLVPETSYHLLRTAHGLFGLDGGVGLMDRRGRAHLMLPVAIGADRFEVRWGLAACLPVGGAALPELPD